MLVSFFYTFVRMNVFRLLDIRILLSYECSGIQKQKDKFVIDRLYFTNMNIISLRICWSESHHQDFLGITYDGV